MRFFLFSRIQPSILALIFTVNALAPASVGAQEALQLSPVGMIAPSPSFVPPILKGVITDSQNAFHFNFVLDTGHAKLETEELKKQSSELIKYFLAALTIPEKDLWVNLSPDEPDRIVPKEFGNTGMGRDLLEQDYFLKQLTASLIYPEGDVGRKFWDKIYKKAQKEFGTTTIPVNVFHKVWIVPDTAHVYEENDRVFILKTHLKVLLEEEYLEKNKKKSDKADQFSTTVIREIILPEIEREVNKGAQFAKLRQIYHSFILASWYKAHLKESLLNQSYSDQKKIGGIDLEDKNAKEKIYQEYLENFRRGAYNYIKEEVDPVTEQIIPRKYFSGGLRLDSGVSTATSDRRDFQREFLPGAQVQNVSVNFQGGPIGGRSSDEAMLVSGDGGRPMAPALQRRVLSTARTSLHAALMDVENLVEQGFPELAYERFEVLYDKLIGILSLSPNEQQVLLALLAINWRNFYPQVKNLAPLQSSEIEEFFRGLERVRDILPGPLGIPLPFSETSSAWSNLVGGPANLRYLQRQRQLFYPQGKTARTKAVYLASGADISTILALTDADEFVFLDKMNFLPVADAVKSSTDPFENYLENKKEDGWAREGNLMNPGVGIEGYLRKELELIGARHVSLSETVNSLVYRLTFEFEGRERTLIFINDDASSAFSEYAEYVKDTDFLMSKAAMYGGQFSPLMDHDLIDQAVKPGGYVIFDSAFAIDPDGVIDQLESQPIPRDEELLRLEAQGASIGYDPFRIQGLYAYRKKAKNFDENVTSPHSAGTENRQRLSDQAMFVGVSSSPRAFVKVSPPMEEAIQGITNLVRWVHDRPRDAILFSGRSAARTRQLFEAVWDKIYGSTEPRPEIFVLDGQTNDILYRRAEWTDSMIRDHLEDALGEAFADLVDARVALIDDHAQSGMKMNQLQTLFARLGFRDMTLGVMVASEEAELPLRGLFGVQSDTALEVLRQAITLDGPFTDLMRAIQAPPLTVPSELDIVGDTAIHAALRDAQQIFEVGHWQAAYEIVSEILETLDMAEGTTPPELVLEYWEERYPVVQPAQPFSMLDHIDEIRLQALGLMAQIERKAGAFLPAKNWKYPPIDAAAVREAETKGAPYQVLVGGALNLAYLRRMREVINPQGSREKKVALYLAAGADISTALLATDATDFIFVDQIPFAASGKGDVQNMSLISRYLAVKRSLGAYAHQSLMTEAPGAWLFLKKELEVLGAEDISEPEYLEGESRVRITFRWQGVVRTLTYLSGKDARDLGKYRDEILAQGGVDFLMTKAGMYKRDKPLVEAQMVRDLLNPDGYIVSDSSLAFAPGVLQLLEPRPEPDPQMLRLERQGAQFGYTTPHVSYVYRKKTMASTPAAQRAVPADVLSYGGSGGTAIHQALKVAEEAIDAGEHPRAQEILVDLLLDLYSIRVAEDIPPIRKRWEARYSQGRPMGDLIIDDIERFINTAQERLSRIPEMEEERFVGGRLNWMHLRRTQQIVHPQQDDQRRLAVYLGSGADILTAVMATDASDFLFVDQFPFYPPADQGKGDDLDAQIRGYLGDKDTPRSYVIIDKIITVGGIWPFLEAELKVLGAKNISEPEAINPGVYRLTFEWRGKLRHLTFVGQKDVNNLEEYIHHLGDRDGADFLILKAGMYKNEEADSGREGDEPNIHLSGEILERLLKPQGYLIADSFEAFYPRTLRESLRSQHQRDGVLEVLERYGARFGYLGIDPDSYGIEDESPEVWLYQKQQPPAEGGERHSPDEAMFVDEGPSTGDKIPDIGGRTPIHAALDDFELQISIGEYQEIRPRLAELVDDLRQAQRIGDVGPLMDKWGGAGYYPAVVGAPIDLMLEDIPAMIIVAEKFLSHSPNLSDPAMERFSRQFPSWIESRPGFARAMRDFLSENSRRFTSRQLIIAQEYQLLGLYENIFWQQPPSAEALVMRLH
ncbi:MAG: hypothetical protein NUV91_01425, partial [Candidatus Omnitrophica bacterium]|nr:hypothetical protein [Candidatus Omnitrophota bacterium]